jgi:hypothetical protein
LSPVAGGICGFAAADDKFSVRVLLKIFFHSFCVYELQGISSIVFDVHQLHEINNRRVIETNKCLINNAEVDVSWKLSRPRHGVKSEMSEV